MNEITADIQAFAPLQLFAMVVPSIDRWKGRYGMIMGHNY